MSYEDFQDYLRKLRDADDPEIQIHWPVIDIDGVEAKDHSSRFGLQLADLAVSGLRACLEPDPYGNLEPRFAEMLKPRAYNRNKNYISYGAKLYPTPAKISAFSRDDVHPANLDDWLRIFG